jgi:hypothetical protein
MIAFPSSVEKYTSNIMDQHVLFNDPQDGDRRGEIAIDTIVLARELDLPFLLPAALWFSSTHLATWTHKNIRSLTDADRNTIISATPPLRVAFADYLYGWLDETLIRSADCTTCRHVKLLYSLKLWKPPGGKLTFNWRLGAAESLCRRCVDVGRQHHSEGAKRLWKELPSFFGLSPWEELLAGAPDE